MTEMTDRIGPRTTWIVRKLAKETGEAPADIEEALNDLIEHGHLRIVRTTVRVGDNTQLAEVSFVDDIKAEAVPVAAEKAEK